LIRAKLDHEIVWRREANRIRSAFKKFQNDVYKNGASINEYFREVTTNPLKLKGYFDRDYELVFADKPLHEMNENIEEDDE
jgi:hypothetical protein